MYKWRVVGVANKKEHSQLDVYIWQIKKNILNLMCIFGE